MRSRLYRLISCSRSSRQRFRSDAHEYATSNRGLIIEASAESAERIITTYFRQREGESNHKPAVAIRAEPLAMATVLVVEDEFGIAGLFRIARGNHFGT